jgi:hypothetical protein
MIALLENNFYLLKSPQTQFGLTNSGGINGKGPLHNNAGYSRA